ncbi:chorismate mutase [Azospirillum halopraeferens]|uniref:chorismate mutase n=1 Tax=Azospirillum halopraeferens TaxID=34010 RepID=UPI0004115854|nr:chorismate mutase [Azospirillum halopraeferens]
MPRIPTPAAVLALCLLAPVVAAPAGAQTPRPLSEIRKDIDAVDHGLLELLNRRSGISLEVAAAKKDGQGPVYRPGRQAALLRRLAERNDGPLPDAAAWRIWQEIIASSIGLQTDFRVAHAGAGVEPYALATAYFGSGTALVAADSAAALGALIAAGGADVGVLALDGNGTWWRDLAAQGDAAPALQVVARLPFLPPAPGHVAATGFVLAPYEADPSGDDRTLLVVETTGAAADRAVATALESLGWRGASVLARVADGATTGLLVEAEGAPPGDGGAAGPVVRVSVIGRYAVPLPR